MPTLHEPVWDVDLGSQGGRLRAIRPAQRAGARRLAANLYELEQGAVVSPLHFHHANEELLFVLTGMPTVRCEPGVERELASGEVVALPPSDGLRLTPLTEPITGDRGADRGG